MSYSQFEHLKSSIDDMSLEDLKTSILVEMRNTPVFSREVSEYLLQTYENRLAELYW
ncbi:hypothetical protein [Streptomyces sp. WG5]|uniref:hypothetical protein n=1 Tax=Streptomyces sp. WG5 TaxID=3417648 RepID=UPI003CE9227E